MKSKSAEFLEAHQSGERSTFVEDVKWRQESSMWLKRSQRVSYVIMDYNFAIFAILTIKIVKFLRKLK